VEYLTGPLVIGLALVGALIVGASKAATPGAGVLSVGIFALAFPPRESVGIALPLLIAGDIVALSFYRRAADWGLLVRLLPGMALGVVAGYLVVRFADERVVALIIAGLIVLTSLYELVIRRGGRSTAQPPDPRLVRTRVIASASGIAAGGSSMIANAGGPALTLYLVYRGLATRAFLGTSAWFFFVVNLGKLPFSVTLGLVTPASLEVGLILLPAMVLGAWCGRWLILRLSQSTFERISLIASGAAGLFLLGLIVFRGT